MPVENFSNTSRKSEIATFSFFQESWSEHISFFSSEIIKLKIIPDSDCDGLKLSLKLFLVSKQFKCKR